MHATVHVLRQLDVGDAIDLDRAAEVLRAREPTRGPSHLRGREASPTAGVVLAQKPIDVPLGAATVGRFHAQVRLRAFDFGVAALRFTIELGDLDAAGLVAASMELSACSPAFDAEARRLWRDLAGSLAGAISPNAEGSTDELLEDYIVWMLPEPPAERATEIFAHVLLGEPESRRLAPSLLAEIGRRAIRWYEDDLVVVDYDAAIVVDRAPVQDLVDLFEIASAQLLELRFYDALVARAESGIAADARAARTGAWLLRSPFLSVGRRAAVLALEVAEMTDRLGRAISLVGDTYTVQVYRETALRFRLGEAQASVREKIGTVGRVAEMLGSQVQSSRDLTLEILVVVLILVEVIIALRPG